MVTLGVHRTGRGQYQLVVQHWHDGEPFAHCPHDCYEALSWTELNDVVLASLDSYRPGAAPLGWEQLPLFGDADHELFGSDEDLR